MSYSWLLIHISWRVHSKVRIEPPIQTLALSGKKMILIFIVLGARVVVVCILSAMPDYMVVPPDITVLAQVFPDVHITVHNGVEGGLMDVTEHLNCSLPVVIICPSDSSSHFSREVIDAAVAMPCSKSRAT